MIDRLKMFSDDLLVLNSKGTLPTQKSGQIFSFLFIPPFHQNNALNNPIRCVLLLIGCDVRWWHKGCGWGVCVNSLGKHKSRFAIVPMGARCCRREAACGAVKQFDIVIIFQLANGLTDCAGSHAQIRLIRYLS